MGKNKRVPAIRFKGFTEEWVEKKLGDNDVTSSYSGGTPPVSISEYYNGSIPFIRSGEINSNFTELFITNQGLNNSSAKLVNIGDILYALYGATSGEVGISLIDGAINQAILAIKPQNNYDAKFISYWLRQEKSNIINTYLQGGQGNLSGGIVKELIIAFPSYAEQKQIGEFFQNVDSLINANQRKLDKLKNIKKACLEKMFPRKGSTIPEIRFKGFTEEWEEKTLGEICTVTIGEFVIQTKQDPNAPYPVYNGGLSNTGFYKEYNQEGPKVIISARGANAGFVNKYESKYWAGNSCYSIGIINNDSWLFLYYTLKYNEETFRKQQQSANIPSVSKAQVVNIAYLAPQIEEQIQIGNFFKNLDNLIAKNEQQLEKLKNIKKACLEKMFVNKEDAI